MKKTFLYISLLAFVFNLMSAYALVTPEETRSADTIAYYVINPHGNHAEFTWTISGGTIIGHSSPYTATGADTIKVLWDDTNKNSANFGSLRVSEVVNWPGGPSCSSDEMQIDVEAWVRPKTITDTSDIIVCSCEEFVITVDFEGLLISEWAEILRGNRNTGTNGKFTIKIIRQY